MSKELSKIHDLFDFDKNQSKDFDCVIGTDEAGRGPGAGPVVAAAVCFHGQIDKEIFEKLQLLNDSKQLTEKKREVLFDFIKELEKSGKCICSIKEGSVEQIEKMNILNTSLDCMKRSCEEVTQKLNTKSVRVLVDGNRIIKNFYHPQLTVVKGDSKSASIAAASILAKVSRDRFMGDLAQKYPQYHWEKNKGYLSSEHIAAIKEFGPTKWHRPKFLRKILNESVNVEPSKTQKSRAEIQDSQLSLFQ